MSQQVTSREWISVLQEYLSRSDQPNEETDSKVADLFIAHASEHNPPYWILL